jgi:hypothetical protein
VNVGGFVRFSIYLSTVSLVISILLSACGGGGGSGNPVITPPSTGGGGATPMPTSSPTPSPTPTSATAWEYGLPDTEIIYDIFLSETGQPWIVTQRYGASGQQAKTLLSRMELVGNGLQIAEQFDGTFPTKNYVRRGVVPRFITAERVYWEVSDLGSSTSSAITRIPLGGAPLEVPIQGQPAGTLTQYPNRVTSLIIGADGNIWFNGSLTDAVGKITREGQWLTTYDVKVGLPFGGPIGLLRSKDGNVWMSLYGSGQIASMTLSGAITYVDVDLKTYKNTVLSVGRIVEASDDNFYFLRDQGLLNACAPREIGRVTKAGQITMFDAPVAGTFAPYASSCKGLVGLSIGLDGALWFADTSRNSIGRMDLDGQFTEVVLPAIRPDNPKQRNTGSIDDWKPEPVKMVVAPDGKFWVWDRMANRILVIQAQ